jgi:hypothetical protein
MAALPETATGMVGRFCQPGMASAWRSEQREHSTFHAGFAYGFDGYGLMAALPSTWQAEPHWGDWPYYVGWRHDQDRAVLIYCEGDLSIEIADSQEAYLELLRRTNHAMTSTSEDERAFLDWLEAHLANPERRHP